MVCDSTDWHATPCKHTRAHRRANAGTHARAHFVDNSNRKWDTIRAQSVASFSSR